MKFGSDPLQVYMAESLYYRGIPQEKALAIANLLLRGKINKAMESIWKVRGYSPQDRRLLQKHSEQIQGKP